MRETLYWHRFKCIERKVAKTNCHFSVCVKNSLEEINFSALILEITLSDKEEGNGSVGYLKKTFSHINVNLNHWVFAKIVDSLSREKKLFCISTMLIDKCIKLLQGHDWKQLKLSALHTRFTLVWLNHTHRRCIECQTHLSCASKSKFPRRKEFKLIAKRMIHFRWFFLILFVRSFRKIKNFEGDSRFIAWGANG